jgi:uncharacterized membrane protein YvlD (DUF360 family)
MITLKTKQFCETSFKNGKLSAELTASYQWILRFFHSICLKYCSCHEKVIPGYTKYRKIILAILKIWFSKIRPILENYCLGLRIFVIGIFLIFCYANSFLQILLKHPPPASVFEIAIKNLPCAHFWQGIELLAPATTNNTWTSKSGPNVSCL